MDGYDNKEAALAVIHKHNIKFPNLTGNSEKIKIMVSGLTGNDWGGTPLILVYSPSVDFMAA